MSGARVCAPLETREGCERVDFDAQRAELLAIRVAPCVSCARTSPHASTLEWPRVDG